MLHIVLLIVARCAKECTSGVPASAGLGSSAGLLSSSLLPEQQLGEGVPGFRNLPSFPLVCDTAFVAPLWQPWSNQAAVPLSRRFGASVDSIQGYCSG